MNDTRLEAMILVDNERNRENAKWGEQNHPPQFWVGILGEEFGEYCQAVNETVFDNGESERAKGGTDNIILELTHVAAVAVSHIECLLRQKGGKDKWIRYHEWAESISEIEAERDEANNYAQENEDYALKVESERDEWKAKFEQADRMFIAADDAASRFEEKCKILTAERDRMREALKSIKDWLHIYLSAESVFTVADGSAREGLGKVSDKERR